ncbi:MAG: hypothetical protein JO219_07710 [Candidatus Eremiobacteraeota bacterium]|nr:hypothetical protein [Candidatus Eremiobacteraeota bacterium]
MIDSASAKDLRFTTHALVRYVERHVDAGAVKMLRRRGLRDGAILRALAPRFDAQLQLFRSGVSACAHRGLRAQSIAGVPFRLKVGRMRVVIHNGRCVTVLPADRMAS